MPYNGAFIPFQFKSSQSMMISEFNDSARSLSKNKENSYCHSSRDYDNLKSIIARNEHVLIDIRKELKQKVNKTEFLSALSSKVALSDLTSLTQSFSNHDQDCSYQNSPQIIKEIVQQEVSSTLARMKSEKSEGNEQISKAIEQIQAQLVGWEQTFKKKQAEYFKEMRENDQNINQSLEKKVERTEFDKMMHLSSLLAIEFELIKKRFSTFEVDYNLVWKEISNLYTNHESLRSVIQTSRNESLENTREKQLQVLLKTGKNNCVGRLFVEKEEVKEFEGKDIELVALINQKMESVEHLQNDHEFSINNLGERLQVIEKDYNSWVQGVRDINRLKREYNESKLEITILENNNRKMREDMNEQVQASCEAGLKEICKGISVEIKQVCEEITSRMMQLFSECAKLTQTQVLRKNISDMEDHLLEKLDEVVDNNKKRFQVFGIKHEQHEDKLRLFSRDLSCRLKIEDFDQVKQNFVTTDSSQALLKKTETLLKKQINEFRDSQKVINEVVCSETILARWIWVSGDLRGGNLISWDKEAVNTLPENFIYNQSDLTFRIMSSGIYKLEMGFYAKKKPSIQILINGKTIISAVNSSSYVMHHSSGKLKDITNSEVAGLTYYDFFTLQENTRLAISYNGEAGHGFFGIQRL